MIRFFRDIRRRLIVPDNIRKYLLYAIGEIVLVVIGILIALQINNRNELKKIERFELSMLAELETALEGDSAIVVDFFEPRMDTKEAAIDSFFSAMLENRSFSKEEFFNIYGNMFLIAFLMLNIFQDLCTMSIFTREDIRQTLISIIRIS